MEVTIWNPNQNAYVLVLKGGKKNKAAKQKMNMVCEDYFLFQQLAIVMHPRFTGVLICWAVVK